MNRIGHKIQEVDTFKKIFELKNLNNTNFIKEKFIYMIFYINKI